MRLLILILSLLVAGCASYERINTDKTNILPGQRVNGLGFTFSVPTRKAWFAAVYGNSHRIRLVQLNDLDSYTLEIALNNGPPLGMYPDARTHLRAVKRHKHSVLTPKGMNRLSHEEWIDQRFGDLCVRYSSLEADWRGREARGPAKVETIGLTCAHQSFGNVLIDMSLSRRTEKDAAEVDLVKYADFVFASVKYADVK